MVTFLGVALGLGALAFLATALRGRAARSATSSRACESLGAVIVGRRADRIRRRQPDRKRVARIRLVDVAPASPPRCESSAGSPWPSASSARGPSRPIGHRRSAPSTVAVRGGRRRPRIRHDQASRQPHVRWIPSADRGAVVGVGLIISSFWFDGHTVSKGFPPVACGGRTACTSRPARSGSVGSSRWRRSCGVAPGPPATRVAELVVRFSKIATIALAGGRRRRWPHGRHRARLVQRAHRHAVGTDALLKTAAVGIAALGGAYNHFRLLPALEAGPGEGDGESARCSTGCARPSRPKRSCSCSSSWSPPGSSPRRRSGGLERRLGCPRIVR